MVQAKGLTGRGGEHQTIPVGSVDGEVSGQHVLQEVGHDDGAAGGPRLGRAEVEVATNLCKGLLVETAGGLVAVFGGELKAPIDVGGDEPDLGFFLGVRDGDPDGAELWTYGIANPCGVVAPAMKGFSDVTKGNLVVHKLVEE